MATKETAPNGAEKIETFASFADATQFADAAREQYEAAMKAFGESAEQFRVQTEEALASARQGFEAANEKMRSLNAEAMSAARGEMTEAVDFANDLARAKSIGDALEIQHSYWTKLFEGRLQRARALAEASAEASRSAFEPLSRSYASAFAYAPAFDKFFPFVSK